MSKIITNNVTKIAPTPQVDVLAADVNTKFSAIATATATLNQENVRSEGIDIRQLSNTSPIMKEAIYTENAMNGLYYNFTIGTGAGGNWKPAIPRPAYHLSYGTGGKASDLFYGDGSPLVLEQGDLLRFHYNFNMYELQINAVAADWPLSSTVDRLGMIFFPILWSTPITTPNTIANASVFPNRIDWYSMDFNNPTSIPQSDPPSAGGFASERLLDDGICFHELAAETISTTKTKPIRRLHGCLNYIHESSTPLTIYQLGVATTPIVSFRHYVAGGFDTRAFTINSVNQTPFYPLTLTMERAHLSAIVLRKGNKGTIW